jgi:hypothetical protein
MIEEKKWVELSDFAGLTGEMFIFSIDGVDEHAEGELCEAKPIGSATAPGVEREPFSLEFKFRPGADLGQSVYQVRTKSGQKFPPLFLVPSASNEEGWYMHVTVN